MSTMVRETARSAARWVFWFTPLRRFMYPKYVYNFTPEQLAFLVGCINKTKPLEGAIYEIGCGAGCTTLFLNRHLQCSGIKRRYVCIDTFKGFTRSDVSWEILHRGKKAGDYREFAVNSPQWFRYTMRANSCDVVCLPMDVQDYQFREKISFCLVDVDLYKPTSYALSNLWPVLEPGGIIVVDDCRERNRWDGAYQAYTEFTKTMGLPETVVLDKLGVVEKAGAALRST